jgi:hypothetical protein
MKFSMAIPILMMAAVSLTACSDKTKSLLEEAAPPPTPSQVVDDLPDWCMTMPESDGSLFACGIGSSTDLTMARSKATLDAKRQLADMIDSEISSRMDDFLSSIGATTQENIKKQSEIVTKNVTVEASLSGYKQADQEVQAINNSYQAYILLEYPIGQANRALMNQIKENDLLSTQQAADEALARLEEEINKKSGN